MGYLGDDGDDGDDVPDIPDISSLQDDLTPAEVQELEDYGAIAPGDMSEYGPLSTAEQQIANANPGYSVDDLANVVNAYQSGALSAAGYNQILSGNVSAGNLQSFLEADPGAPQGSGSGGSSGGAAPGMPSMPSLSKGGGGSSSSQQQSLAQQLAALLTGKSTTGLTTGLSPSPTISTIPASLTSATNFLTQSTLISGIPNWVLLVGAVLLMRK
jgi:hypothetical protein